MIDHLKSAAGCLVLLLFLGIGCARSVSWSVGPPDNTLVLGCAATKRLYWIAAMKYDERDFWALSTDTFEWFHVVTDQRAPVVPAFDRRLFVETYGKLRAEKYRPDPKHYQFFAVPENAFLWLKRKVVEERFPWTKDGQLRELSREVPL